MQKLGAFSTFFAHFCIRLTCSSSIKSLSVVLTYPFFEFNLIEIHNWISCSKCIEAEVDKVIFQGFVRTLLQESLSPWCSPIAFHFYFFSAQNKRYCSTTFPKLICTCNLWQQILKASMKIATNPIVGEKSTVNDISIDGKNFHWTCFRRQSYYEWKTSQIINSSATLTSNFSLLFPVPYPHHRLVKWQNLVGTEQPLAALVPRPRPHTLIPRGFMQQMYLISPTEWPDTRAS